MAAPLRITSGPAIQHAGDLAAVLSSLVPGEVLFLDEIHRMARPAEEMLYVAMEDFRVDIVVGKGPGATAIPLDLAPFTLVGATTRAGLLPGPLRDRFGFTAHMDFYADADLLTIVNRSARLLGVAHRPRRCHGDRQPVPGDPARGQPAAAPGPRLRAGARGPGHRPAHGARRPGPVRGRRPRPGPAGPCRPDRPPDAPSEAGRSVCRPSPSPSPRSRRPSRRWPSRSWSERVCSTGHRAAGWPRRPPGDTSACPRRPPWARSDCPSRAAHRPAWTEVASRASRIRRNCVRKVPP